MTFQMNHDFHLHSQLSLCSDDAEQTTEAMLAYAVKNGFSSLCLTDHYWDEMIPMPEKSGWCDWYGKQNTSHIRKALPLPKAEGVRFCFGCEADMDLHGQVGISAAMAEALDFIVVSTTHLHMTGFTLPAVKVSLERRAELYSRRLFGLLEADLPFHKVGVAHLTSLLIANAQFEDHLTVLDMVKDITFSHFFEDAAARGMGIELNFDPGRYTAEQLPRVLRPYRLAAEAGCRFYLGSDAHHPKNLEHAPAKFRRILAALPLTAAQQYHIP